jgi:hypothetical protein
MFRMRRNGIEQLALVIKNPVIQHQGQLVVAGGQIKALFVCIAKQIHTHHARVEIQPAGAHGVVVIPEHRRVLPVRVVEDARLTGWEPVFRVAVVSCRRTAAMQMNHSTRLRQLPPGAMEAVVDGEKMACRQLVMPLNSQFLVTAGF